MLTEDTVLFDPVNRYLQNPCDKVPEGMVSKRHLEVGDIEMILNTCDIPG